MSPSASRLSRGLLLVGGTAAIVMVGWVGAAAIGREVWRAGWAVPCAILLHAVQLLVSAEGWRIVTEVDRPGLVTWWRLRWIREAVNSMLPVAQIGGNVAGIHLLTRAGVPVVRAGAGTVLDVTAEAAGQAIFTLAGLALLASLGGGHSWGIFAGGTALLVAGVVGFALAQRFGLLRLVEMAAKRLGSASLEGLHEETMALARNWQALAISVVWHALSWALGAFETYLALYAMGSAVSLVVAFVIESLGMAARSIGFLVPGALGVQETGFVLVGGLFGLPADTAIALSMVKRAREVTVGVAGLLAWQWTGVRGTGSRLARSKG